MKKYLVFLYEDYYPRGGFGDFYNSYDDLEEFKNEIYSTYFETLNGKLKQETYIKDNFTSIYGSGFAKGISYNIQILDRDSFEIINFNYNKE